MASHAAVGSGGHGSGSTVTSAASAASASRVACATNDAMPPTRTAASSCPSGVGRTDAALMLVRAAEDAQLDILLLEDLLLLLHVRAHRRLVLRPRAVVARA